MHRRPTRSIASSCHSHSSTPPVLPSVRSFRPIVAWAAWSSSPLPCERLREALDEGCLLVTAKHEMTAYHESPACRAGEISSLLTRTPRRRAPSRPSASPFTSAMLAAEHSSSPHCMAGSTHLCRPLCRSHLQLPFRRRGFSADAVDGEVRRCRSKARLDLRGRLREVLQKVLEHARGSRQKAGVRRDDEAWSWKHLRNAIS